MKTNYKQSQAAPHAKPIFTVSRNDSTLYVLPTYLAGAVMIRLQHIADGDKVKKLCCKVKNDRLMAMEQDVPQGNVTLTAVDIISPEKCAEKGYRKDGYGYVRTLLVTPTAEHRAMFSITCTLGERDAHCGVMVFRNAASMFPVIVPGRIGIDNAVLFRFRH